MLWSPLNYFHFTKHPREVIESIKHLTHQTLNPFFQQNHDAIDNKSKNPSPAIISLSDEFIIYVTWPNPTYNHP